MTAKQLEAKLGPLGRKIDRLKTELAEARAKQKEYKDQLKEAKAKEKATAAKPAAKKPRRRTAKK